MLFIPLKHVPMRRLDFWVCVLFLQICLNRKPQFWLRALKSLATIVFKIFWCRESKFELRLSIERGMHISDIITICEANQLFFCKCISIDGLNFDFGHQNLVELSPWRDSDAWSQNWLSYWKMACMQVKINPSYDDQPAKAIIVTTVISNPDIRCIFRASESDWEKTISFRAAATPRNSGITRKTAMYIENQRRQYFRAYVSLICFAPRHSAWRAMIVLKIIFCLKSKRIQLYENGVSIRENITYTGFWANSMWMPWLLPLLLLIQIPTAIISAITIERNLLFI